MSEIYVWTIVGMSLLAGFTPGPGSLAIAGTAMAKGPRHGFTIAYGMTFGATVWAVLAGVGMGAILIANQWLFESLRFAGAAYLAWLGYRCARSALQPKKAMETRSIAGESVWLSAMKGALIHLTNPKVLFYWASIFVVAVKPGASSNAIFWVIAVSLFMNVVIVTTWATVFSRAVMMRAYARARRWIEGVFAVFFGAAAFAVVTDER